MRIAKPRNQIVFTIAYACFFFNLFTYFIKKHLDIFQRMVYYNQENDFQHSIQ